MALYTVATGATVLAQDVNQYFQLLTGQITDQPVTVANRIRASLSGATVQAALAGGTTSGPPLSGTFQVGDAVISQSGSLFICTSSGSPGTWRTSALPTTTGGPPTTGTWSKGDAVLDSTTFGWWVCSIAGNPGTWVPQGGALTSPWFVTVGNSGVGGSSVYSYQVVATNSQGDAIPSVPVTFTSGNAVLSGSNFNTINWSAPFGCAPLNYKIIRVGGGGTQGLIGTVSGSTFTFGDTGITAGAYSASSVNPGGGFAAGGHGALFRGYLSSNWTWDPATSYMTIGVWYIVGAASQSSPQMNVVFDPLGKWNSSPASWTVPVAGYYNAYVGILTALNSPGNWSGSGAFRVGMQFGAYNAYINNGIWPQGVAQSINDYNYHTISSSGPIYLPGGVTVQMAASSDGGSPDGTRGVSPTIFHDPDKTVMSLVYIGS